MEALALHRLQFAFTITYHYLFPQLTMGLTLLIVILLWRSREGESASRRAARFWLKVLGLNFVMGVVTGIPMEFQFGTNWPRFATSTGNIIGQSLAMEGMFAFFIESSFLYLLLFEERRIGRRLHFFAAVAVFVGSWTSGWFIIVTNAWMQHPVGHIVRGDGSIELVDLWAYLTNPWAFVQYAHTMLGSVLTAATAMAATGAFYRLRGLHTGGIVANQAEASQPHEGEMGQRGQHENETHRAPGFDQWLLDPLAHTGFKGWQSAHEGLHPVNVARAGPRLTSRSQFVHLPVRGAIVVVARTVASNARGVCILDYSVRAQRNIGLLIRRILHIYLWFVVGCHELGRLRSYRATWILQRRDQSTICPNHGSLQRTHERRGVRGSSEAVRRRARTGRWRVLRFHPGDYEPYTLGRRYLDGEVSGSTSTRR